MTAGLVMLLIGILWVALVREKPAGAPDVPAMPVTKYIGVAARSWNVWLVGILLLFFMGSLVTLSGQLADGLHAARGVNPVTAGVLASLVTLATAAGSLIGPAVADRVGWLKPFLVPVGILGALAIYGAWVAPLGAPVTILLILVGLFYGTMQPILIEYPMLLPEIGHTYAGSASGIAMTLFGAGAFFVPSFVMAPLAGSDYTLLFVLAALALLLVALGSGLLPELGRRAAPPRRREAAAAPQPGGPGVGHPL